MKKSFSAGVAVLLPIFITFWVVKYLLDLFTDPLLHILQKVLILWEEEGKFSLHHNELFLILISRVSALICTLGVVVIVGVIARRFIFKKLLSLLDRAFVKIPVIGSIYRIIRDVLKVTLFSDKKSFQETVLLPFPSSETYALGLVTGTISDEFKKIVPNADMTVFVPTAPHPVSGYVLLCPKNSLFSTSLSSEDTLKFLLSCGVVHSSSPLS